MLSMRLCSHTCTADSIPGVSWLTGARVASWSVAAVGQSATTSVVRGTLVDICITTYITREFCDTGRQNITARSLSHSLPKTFLFHKSFPRRMSSGLRTDYTDCMTRPFLLRISHFKVPSLLFCLVRCGRASWLFVNFSAHVNILCRIVSRRCLANLTKN